MKGIFPFPIQTAPSIIGRNVQLRNGYDVIRQLRYDQRKLLDRDNRWKSLFSRHASPPLNAGSLLKVTFRNMASSKNHTQFTGNLVCFKRNLSEPTFTLRGDVDGYIVEQVFCIFSPLLDKIEVLKRSLKRSTKAYWIRDDSKASTLRLKKITAITS